MLPLASSTATVTAGEIAEPAAALLGCCMKVSLVDGPGVMVKDDEVAPVSDGLLDAVSVYPIPTLSRVRPRTSRRPPKR